MYNIGSKFDGGAYNYRNCQRLPEELVGRLAIHEATVKVVSHSAVICNSCFATAVVSAGHCGFRYGGQPLAIADPNCVHLPWHICETTKVSIKKQKLSQRQLGNCVGARPLFDALRKWWLNPIKLAYSSSWLDGQRLKAKSTFNRLFMSAVLVTCYAELAVSSLATAVTIPSTHSTYPWRDGQAELTWVAW